MQKSRRQLWIVLLVLAAILLLYPINNLPLRAATIATILGAWVAAAWHFRNFKPVFYGLMTSGLLIGGFLICPGRTYEPQKLRGEYLQSLRSYEGVRYVWGGENRFGIDCSGLIRAGLIKANFEQGLLTLNPRLVRAALSLWCHDCSAKALGEEYRGLTKRVTSSPGINALDETLILPGDIAVTANGVHVLAYLGGAQWIEADPQFKKVVIVDVPAINNPWFQEPVHLMRWTALETN